MEDTERDRKTGGAHIHEGDPDELVAVVRILDAGLLEANVDEIRDRLVVDDCLVAEAFGRIVDVLTLDDNYIGAVAVSPSRRGQEVGTQLIRAILDHRGRLVVDFDGGVKPSYKSLGFDIEDRNNDEGRFRDVLRDE